MNRLLPFHVATARTLVLALTLILTNAVQVIGQSTKPEWVEVIHGDTRLLSVVAILGCGGLRDARRRVRATRSVHLRDLDRTDSSGWGEGAVAWLSEGRD